MRKCSEVLQYSTALPVVHMTQYYKEMHVHVSDLSFYNQCPSIPNQRFAHTGIQPEDCLISDDIYYKNKQLMQMEYIA